MMGRPKNFLPLDKRQEYNVKAIKVSVLAEIKDVTHMELAR